MLNVLHYVSKMDRAGQETFIMNLFRKIDREKIQFDFLCSEIEVGDYDEEISSLGGNIFYVPQITMRGPIKQIQKFFELFKILRKHRCDVFHIHTHHAMDAFRDALAAKMCGIKIVVVHSHNTNTLYHLGTHKVFKSFLKILSIRRFACSKAAGEWMFGKSRYTVIHNALDLETSYFRQEYREKVRQRMGWNNKKIIGHVGRFNAQKNHCFLIEIFDVIHHIDKNTQLVLVGKGELEEKIRRLVDEKGLSHSVSFLGMREDVKMLYQGMDMLLFPSLFEGLSVVLIEAQACDLPCLVSDTNSEETVVTERLYMKSLNNTAREWAEEAINLLNTSTPRNDNRDEMRQSGYDILELAGTLESVYMKKR